MDLRLEFWTRAWRGPLLAAAVALIAGLPGLIGMPVLDRDEARFAQASAQMLESGDYVSIDFQDRPRFKKPVGIYWMQAAAVKAFSGVEKRRIWAYRIPSLIGAMIAAAACAWGAAGFFGGRRGFVAGAILGATLILSTEAFIAKTDAMLCAMVTLALAALGRLYAAYRDGQPPGRLTRLLFWIGIAVSILVKGPIGPMIALTTILALWAWDRKAPWLKDIWWTWGVAIVLLVVGPWALAITVTTDGGFWTSAVAGDMLSKLNEAGQESHGAPPGVHALLAPVLLFPATLLLPAGLAYGWTCRDRPGVRFALCWLVPAWLIFELSPTKLPHYTLPLYGALAWLIAAAVAEPTPRLVRLTGAILGMMVACALGVGVIYAAKTYGGATATAAATLAAVLFAAAGIAGAVYLLQRRPLHALTAALALGVAAHAVAAGLAAPQLHTLWVAKRTTKALDAARIDPRNGITPGPVAITGFHEPSIVFSLGTETALTDAQGAADAIAEGRPAVVEKGQLAAFLDAVRAYGVTAAPAGEVRGLNYSKGDPVDLFLYRSTVTMPGDQP
jgi:4-amino-4-deoxy-L-arabinose transferase-like glycosyltransferase